MGKEGGSDMEKIFELGTYNKEAAQDLKVGEIDENFKKNIVSLEEIIAKWEITEGDFSIRENKLRKNYFNNVIFSLGALCRQVEDEKILELYNYLVQHCHNIAKQELINRDQVEEFNSNVIKLIELIKNKNLTQN